MLTSPNSKDVSLFVGSTTGIFLLGVPDPATERRQRRTSWRDNLQAAKDGLASLVPKLPSQAPSPTAETESSNPSSSSSEELSSSTPPTDTDSQLDEATTHPPGDSSSDEHVPMRPRRPIPGRLTYRCYNCREIISSRGYCSDKCRLECHPEEANAMAVDDSRPPSSASIYSNDSDAPQLPDVAPSSPPPRPPRSPLRPTYPAVFPPAGDKDHAQLAIGDAVTAH